MLTHCPKCLNPIGPKDAFCRKCGTHLPNANLGTHTLGRPVQAYLQIALGGQGVSTPYALQDQPYEIGQSVAAGGAAAGAGLVKVPSGATAVAPRHARLYPDNNTPITWYFQDLGSTNRSFLNGLHLSRRPVALNNEDELWLGPVSGPTSLRIKYYDPVATPPLKRWLLQPSDPNPLEIGRKVGIGHLVLFSENASDHHARITRVSAGNGLRYELADAGSTNGTFINQVRLGAGIRQALKDGDALRFGESAYVVQQRDPQRLALLPAGHSAAEHLVATGLKRVVRLDFTTWLGKYLAFRRKQFQILLRQAPRNPAPAAPPREKILLRDVDLVIGPNDFVILAGSSGCGKTTLMHILSTFISPQQGALFYKGKPYLADPAVLRPHIGYVPQDDIVHEQLTVYQELLYAAELRLPHLTPDARIARVREVLKQLRLSAKSADRITKLSGGQRKRVNIAVELLSSPGILFLDEPTEGQDLALEQSIVALLRDLANKGTSVVLVSHRLNFLDYADFVGWLAPDGYLVYFGPPEQLGSYFHINPDFAPARRYAAIYRKLEGESSDPQKTVVDPQKLAADYKTSSQYAQLVAGRRQPPALAVSSVPRVTGATGQAQRRGSQFWTLYRRNWAVARADWSFLLWMVAQAPLLGLLLHILTDVNAFHYAIVPPPTMNHPDISLAQQTLFPLAVSAVWLGVFGAMRELVKERNIYRRERMVGLALGPYLASKIALLSMFSVYQSVILVWAVLSKAPLEQATGVFVAAPLEMFFTVLLTSFGGMLLGLLLSAFARTQEVVGALVPLVVIPQFMLSKALGFSLTGVMDFCAKLTFSYWALEALGDSGHLHAVPDDQYHGAWFDPTPSHLLLRWAMLVGLIVLFLVGTWLRQRSRDQYQG